MCVCPFASIFEAEDIRAKGWIKWWTLGVSIRPSLPQKRRKKKYIRKHDWCVVERWPRQPLVRVQTWDAAQTPTHMHAPTTPKPHPSNDTKRWHFSFFFFCSSSVYRFHLPMYIHFIFIYWLTRRHLCVVQSPLRSKLFVICLIRFRRRCLIRARTRDPSI